MDRRTRFDLTASAALSALCLFSGFAERDGGLVLYGIAFLGLCMVLGVWAQVTFYPEPHPLDDFEKRHEAP